MEDRITGELFIRKSAENAPDGSGRKLVIVAGIIAVPENVDLGDETMHVVVGKSMDDVTVLTLCYPHEPAEETRGNGISGILRAPIWRV
jgi:hypothetical protein